MVRRALVKDGLTLSLSKRAKLLGINRLTVYYQQVSGKDVDMMNEIRDIYEQYSFFGYRRITAWLNRKGTLVNRKKVQRLMSAMDLCAVYPKRKLSIARSGNKIYPYLLKKQVPKKANDAWCTDISYI